MSPTDEALTFLAAHQPMPEDAALGEDLIRRFDEVRRYFEDNPDPRCVPLFLGALRSDSSGFGVYQLLDGVLAAHDRDAVVEALRDVLRKADGPRAWVLEFACDYADGELARLASELVNDYDEDVQEWAQTYLDLLRDPKVHGR